MRSGVRHIQQEVQTDEQQGLPVNPRDVDNLQGLGAPVPDVAALIDQALNERFPNGLMPERGAHGIQGPAGRAPTRREILDAAEEYVNSRGGIEAFRGPRGRDSDVAGPAGRGPSASEIRQAVDQFMTEHGQAFVGAPGRPGQPGRDASSPSSEQMRGVVEDVIAQDPDRFRGLPGEASQIPGPAGADSTVPGPAGADSTVPGPAGVDSTVPGPEPSDERLRQVFDDAVRADPDRFRGEAGRAGERGASVTREQMRQVYGDIMQERPEVFQGPPGPASTIPGPRGAQGPGPSISTIDAMIQRRMQNFSGPRPPASEASTQYDDARSQAPSSDFSHVSRMTTYYDALGTQPTSSNTGYYTPGGESSVYNSARSGASMSVVSAGPGSVRSQAGSVRDRSPTVNDGSSSEGSAPGPSRRRQPKKRRTADQRLIEDNAMDLEQDRGKSNLADTRNRRLQ